MGVAAVAIVLGVVLLWSGRELEQGGAGPAAPSLAARASTRVTSLAPPPDASARKAPPSRSALALSRRRADELRAKIRTLYGNEHPRRQVTNSAGAASSAGPAPARMPSPVGSGNQAKQPLGQYIQAIVREQFLPLAGSCYEELLSRSPEKQGKVVLELVIAGDDSVGGVVDEVEFGGGTSLDDPEFGLCMKESMKSLVLDAPPDGRHYVTVTYPFHLEP